MWERAHPQGVNTFFLRYLPAANHPIPLSISICISAADFCPLKRLKLLPSLLHTSLRLRADLRSSCTCDLETLRLTVFLTVFNLIKIERHQSDIHPNAARINSNSRRSITLP